MARDFNGSTDRLDWSALATLTGSPITISAWINSDGWAGNADYIFNIHVASNTGPGIIVFLSSTVRIVLTRVGGTLLSRGGSAPATLTGAWHHVLVTHDGTFTDYTTIHIYIDGTERSDATGASNGATETAPTGSWSLGGRISDDVRNFDGSLAEVGVWNVVLDSTKIAALASGSAPSFYPTNLQYYYSAKTDTTTAETGGAAATVDGTAYDADHPTITYPSGSAIVSGSVTLLGQANNLFTGSVVVPPFLVDDIILEWFDIINGSATMDGNSYLTANGISAIQSSFEMNGNSYLINNAINIIQSLLEINGNSYFTGNAISLIRSLLEMSGNSELIASFNLETQIAQIEKVVSCFDELTATRAGTYIVPSYGMYWLYTADNYEPTPSEIYFEAVLSTSLSGSAAYAELHNGTSQITEISADSTSASWVRSGNIVGSIVNGGQYRVRIKSLGAGATTTLYAARIVIVQSGIISKTETIYQFGSSFITSSTSYTNDTAKSYYYWDSNQFDGNVVCYFEGLVNNQTAGASTSAILIDSSGSVLGSEISVVGTTETRIRSGSFILSDGLVNIRLKAGASNARLRQARLIITQTGSPTKTETYYPIGKSFATITTGSYKKPILWDSDNWHVASKEIYHQTWLNRVAGTSNATLYSFSGSGNIDTLSESVSATIVREISGSLVLPNDFYDTYYFGSNGTGFGTDIIVRTIITSGSSGSSLVLGSSIMSGYGDTGFYAYLLLYGITEFSANGQLVPFGYLNIPSNILMTSDGSLFVTSLSIVQSAIELLGSEYLSLVPMVTIPSNISLGGAGYLVATAFIQALVEGQVILSGQGDLILNALNLIGANTSVSGESLLLLQSLILIYANEILSGRTDIQADSNVLINSISQLSGFGNLIAVAFIEGLVSGEISLYGSGEILSNALKLVYAQQTIGGRGDISPDAVLTILNSLTLEGLAFLIASGFIVGPIVTVTGEAVLYGRSDLITTALNIVLGQSINSAEGILSAQSLVTLLANAILNGQGNIEANSVLLMSAVAVLSGIGAIIAIGTIPAEILVGITPLSRTFVIPYEDRVFVIDQEGRVYVIKGDKRNFDIEE